MTDVLDNFGGALVALDEVTDGNTTALARFVESAAAAAAALKASPTWGPRMAAEKARREAERAAEVAANRADFLRPDHERAAQRAALLERFDAIAATADPEDFRQACWLMRHHGAKP